MNEITEHLDSLEKAITLNDEQKILSALAFSFHCIYDCFLDDKGIESAVKERAFTLFQKAAELNVINKEYVQEKNRLLKVLFEEGEIEVHRELRRKITEVKLN